MRSSMRLKHKIFRERTRIYYKMAIMLRNPGPDNKLRNFYFIPCVMGKHYNRLQWRSLTWFNSGVNADQIINRLDSKGRETNPRQHCKSTGNGGQRRVPGQRGSDQRGKHGSKKHQSYQTHRGQRKELKTDWETTASLVKQWHGGGRRRLFLIKRDRTKHNMDRRIITEIISFCILWCIKLNPRNTSPNSNCPYSL